MGATAGLTTLAGGAISAYSQYQAGKMSGKLNDLNAGIAKSQAKDAIERGREGQRVVRRRGAQIVGAQRASFAGQGVDVNSGSAAELQSETRQLSEMDALTIRNNAALEAWGYNVNAAEASFQGTLARLQGKQQAIGTLLTSGTQAAVYGSDWYYNQGGKQKIQQGRQDEYGA